MDAAAVGELIAQLRKQKGMTQQELAERLHVTNKAVSNWERGKNFPDLALMQPLASELGVTVSELLGLEHQVPDESIAVISALSQCENRSIKWSLYQLTFLSLIVGAMLVLARLAGASALGRSLTELLPVSGLILLLVSSMTLEKLIRKFSGQNGYRWPEAQEETLFRSVKIQLDLWRERIGRRHRE